MSEISKQALKVDNSQSFPDNNAGAITPSDLRAFNTNMIDSLVDEITFNSFSSSVTNSIDLLSAFTASQQPTFNALNQFTASQLTINTGINAFTYSANVSLNSLDGEVANLKIWTSSVNEISFNSGVPNYATRWNFGGFISASFVENVGGRIADITVLNDPSKLNTSSFNEYTASTAATQSVFSASVATSISQSSATFTQFSASQNIFNSSITSSVQQLLDLSSSLSGGYATQGELDAVSSSLSSTITSVSASLTNTINTKLNTSSFNAFTQSQNNLNVTFATTGSNTFVGNQTIIGNFTLSGSSFISGNQELVGIIQASDANAGLQGFAPTVFQGVGTTAVAYDQFVNDGNYDAIHIESNLNAGTKFQDYNGSGLNTWLQIPTNTGSNPSPIFKRGLKSEGSFTITGSVYGNVSASVINAATTSIDLSVANYFTLTLSGSTNINVTNPRAGVTATLVINTSTNATASFSSNVKQPSGSLYVASPSGNVDIISFTAVNDTTVYAFAAQSFV